MIEALITLVVLTVALGPALILATNISSVSSVIKNNLIAANLAQEGIEVVRSIRDTNWFLGIPFDSGLGTGAYRIEWNSGSVLSLGSNPTLKEDNGLYNYSTGNDTIFKRTVTVTKVNAGELRIESSVTWDERGGNAQNLTVESHLFDWK